MWNKLCLSRTLQQGEKVGCWLVPPSSIHPKGLTSCVPHLGLAPAHCTIYASNFLTQSVRKDWWTWHGANAHARHLCIFVHVNACSHYEVLLPFCEPGHMVSHGFALLRKIGDTFWAIYPTFARCNINTWKTNGNRKESSPSCKRQTSSGSQFALWNWSSCCHMSQHAQSLIWRPGPVPLEIHEGLLTWRASTSVLLLDARTLSKPTETKSPRLA